MPDPAVPDPAAPRPGRVAPPAEVTPGLDEAALAVAYSAQGTVSPERFAAVMRDYRARSDEAVGTLRGLRGVRYDPDSAELLDVWGLPPQPAGGSAPGGVRPVVVAVHGGYWRMLGREDTAFMAGALDAAGIATVAVDYTLAPQATIAEMVRQVRRSVAWVHHEGPALGLDPGRVVVVGSSAGAHLAASTLVAGWQEALGLPPVAVSGGLLVSGLFDLRPLVRTFPNAWLHLDARSAAAASPLLGTPTPVPVVVARAEHEAAGFVAQSDAFHDRWAAHAPATRLVVPGRDHFDVFLDLADPRSGLSTALHHLVDPQENPS